MIFVLAGLAAAADGPVSLGAHLTGEAVRDPRIGAVYGDTSLGVEAVGNAPLPWAGLEAGVTVGYRRLGGQGVTEGGLVTDEASWMWWAPLSLTVGKRVPLRGVTVSGEVGPSYVMWAEKPGNDPDVGYMGGKWGVLVEGGLRVPVGDPGPTLFDPSRAGRGVDVSATIGYRKSFRRNGDECVVSPCGLDFSALRLSAGAVARF